MLNYLKVREGGPFAFVTFGYAENSVERAVARIEERRARFILMAEGFPEGELPEFLNRVNGGVQALLDENRLPFRYRTTVRLTEQIVVKFYERVPDVSFVPRSGGAAGRLISCWGQGCSGLSLRPRSIGALVWQ
jgi:hypothetical protein